MKINTIISWSFILSSQRGEWLFLCCVGCQGCYLSALIFTEPGISSSLMCCNATKLSVTEALMTISATINTTSERKNKEQSQPQRHVATIFPLLTSQQIEKQEYHNICLAIMAIITLLPNYLGTKLNGKFTNKLCRGQLSHSLLHLYIWYVE